ncbi:MAG: class II aldolase/adducin family protein [Oscillospiraceae bacterium]|jgi:L-fuculose-phosphate aldolase|nr:class II aldolase/adducin family protein [Oscillospiraceae bacterium]
MQNRRYPTDQEARQEILEVGRRMYMKNFVAANDGNISCKVASDQIWTTPTGVSKGFMTEKMLVKMRLDGTILSMGELKPSSEVKMHLRAYHENPEIGGVTHAHPPICTSFAIAGLGLDKAIYPEALVNLGTVPCVHYETPGSQGIPDSIAPYCRDYNALLLANHGALSWGKSLMEAFFRLEAMEHYALILMYTGNVIGQARELSCDQVQELLGIREKLGIHAGGIPPCADRATNLKDVVCPNRGVAGACPCGRCGRTGGVKAAPPPAAPAAQGDDLERIKRAVLARLAEKMQ